MIKELNKATTDFKKLYVKLDKKMSSEREFSPIAALNQTIKETYVLKFDFICPKMAV